MKSKYRRRICLTATALLAMAWTCFAANRSPAKPADAQPAVLTAMQDELDRSMATLSKADPPAYFISYTISDRQYVRGLGIERRAAFEHGRSRALARGADASRQLSTRRHAQAAEPAAQLDQPGHVRVLDDDIPVLRREIWRETDQQYRAAVASPDQGKDQRASAGADG